MAKSMIEQWIEESKGLETVGIRPMTKEEKKKREKEKEESQKEG